jgi:hypothetical protein
MCFVICTNHECLNLPDVFSRDWNFLHLGRPNLLFTRLVELLEHLNTIFIDLVLDERFDCRYSSFKKKKKE